MANFRFKICKFVPSTAQPDFLIFLKIKGLLTKTNYAQFVFYLISINEQKIKEIDSSTSAMKPRFRSLFPESNS